MTSKVSKPFWKIYQIMEQKIFKNGQILYNKKLILLFYLKQNTAVLSSLFL